MTAECASWRPKPQIEKSETVAKRHLTPDDEIGRLLEHRLQRTTAPAGEVCADAEPAQSRNITRNRRSK